MNLLVRHGRSWSGRERNCCFLNTKNGDFASVASVSGLDIADDCRAVAVTDWDLDGKSDLWISSRTGSRVRFFHNRNSAPHRFVAFKLQGVDCNRDAIGARLTLYLGADGLTERIQTLHAGEGFLSQSTKWTTFGLADESTINRLVVDWPSGESEEFRGLRPNSRYVIQQYSGQGVAWSRPSHPSGLRPSEIQLPVSTGTARIITLARPLVPNVQYVTAIAAGNASAPKAKSILDTINSAASGPRPRGVLVNLWSTSCQPCLQELSELSERASALRESGISVLALCVDSLDEAGESTETVSRADEMLDDLKFPFDSGMATEALVRGLSTLHQSLVDLQHDLPIPCSFLVSASGELVAMYKGKLGVDQLLEDAKLLVADAVHARDAAVPFAGTWITKPIPPYPQDVALKLVEQGDADGAVEYLRTFLENARTSRHTESRADLADIHFLLGRILADRGDVMEGMTAYRQATIANPDYRKAHINLADLLLKTNRPDQALQQLQQAIRLDPDDPSVWVTQGVAFARERNTKGAEQSYRKALQLQPGHRQARANLARLVHAQGRAADAVTQYHQLLAYHPRAGAEANNLAWLLATSADPAIHDPTDAVKWAEVACRITEHTEPRYLTTLAAAYSEASRFEDAVRIIRRAIETAKEGGNSRFAKTLEKHQRWYETGMSYQEGRGRRK